MEAFDTAVQMALFLKVSNQTRKGVCPVRSHIAPPPSSNAEEMKQKGSFLKNGGGGVVIALWRLALRFVQRHFFFFF